MKHLLFLLLLIPLGAISQTANYTLEEGNKERATNNHSIFYDIGIDTLSGSNDTLLITFDRTFPAFYGATYTGVLAASSTSTTAKVEILGRNKSSETWVIVDDVSLSSEGVTLALTADINYMYVALRLVSTTGNAHVNSSFLLKKKSSSAATGGGASYLVYTALLTQTGTNAPVATVLENTLGGTVVWSYDDTGVYVGTLTGAFPADKTVVFGQPRLVSSGEYASAYRDNDNMITVEVNDGADNRLSNYSIEIRVYP